MVVAMIMAANREIPEVCVFFSDHLLRANRTVKVDRCVELEALQRWGQQYLQKKKEIGK